MVTYMSESGLKIKLTVREPTFVWTGQSTLASGHRTSSTVMELRRGLTMHATRASTSMEEHGIDTFKLGDSSMFIGEFYNNNILGKGVYMWSDGLKYVGEWKNNNMYGKGTFTWSDGRMYFGEYFDDKKNGCGEFD